MKRLLFLIVIITLLVCSCGCQGRVGWEPTQINDTKTDALTFAVDF